MIEKLRNIFKIDQDKRRITQDKKTVGCRSYPVNEDWDMIVNLLLDSCKIIKFGNHTVTFEGGTEVWISNKWHAYGRPWDVNGFNDVLPSPTTAIRLDDTIKDLKKEYVKQCIKEIKESMRK